MELTELKTKICETFSGGEDDLHRILELVEDDNSIFPFNEYEHLLSHLIHVNGLTFEEYLEIRSDYIRQNPNLWLFEISAPRGYGEKFAQMFIQGKCIKLKKPSKELDPYFTGEYDLWLDGIKIEVKASRAVDSDSDEPLYTKALKRNTTKPFLMNFPQLKPQCCDVFLWLAVFRDEIVIWVMNSKEVENHPLFSKGQHRGNIGNEGQIHVKHDNMQQFKEYELGDKNLETLIKQAAKRVN